MGMRGSSVVGETGPQGTGGESEGQADPWGSENNSHIGSLAAGQLWPEPPGRQARKEGRGQCWEEHDPPTDAPAPPCRAQLGSHGSERSQCASRPEPGARSRKSSLVRMQRARPFISKPCSRVRCREYSRSAQRSQCSTSSRLQSAGWIPASTGALGAAVPSSSEKPALDTPSEQKLSGPAPPQSVSPSPRPVLSLPGTLLAL